MVQYGNFQISYLMIGFICVAALLIGGLAIAMRIRHSYHPNLIGALIGAFLCFLLLEALPAII